MSNSITTLFLDIGGVLLTNGWDHNARKKACDKFGMDYVEMNERHNMTFSTYEIGKVSLEKYLKRVVFYRERDFNDADFKKFMFEQSRPFSEAIDFFGALKSKYNLNIAAVSNEGRDLTEHRVRTFKLADIIDFFICSAFVHFRKPDEDMYQLALDTAMVLPENVFYIDDREMFIEVARGLGIRGHHHTTLESTKEQLSRMDLRI